ncbi:MAG: preprotein translocase subunit YajC [Bacteroidetes bacterium]|nr:preprotein translocase subunit YajC [Bacteroidota bacterium]
MGAPPEGQSAGNPFVQLLPFLLIIVVLYFMMIRPQKKRQQEREKMISGVQKGDKIITVGGLHGKVELTKEKSVVIKIADGVKVELERSAIAALVQNTGKTADAEILQPETTN